MHADARGFIASIRSRPWLAMLHAVEGALVSFSLVRAQPRADVRDELRMVRFLAAVRDYLLSEGRVRPASMDDADFALLRPLCEHLVRTGRFPERRLELFSGPGWHAGMRAPARGEYTTAYGRK